MSYKGFLFSQYPGLRIIPLLPLLFVVVLTLVWGWGVLLFIFQWILLPPGVTVLVLKIVNETLRAFGRKGLWHETREDHSVTLHWHVKEALEYL